MTWIKLDDNAVDHPKVASLTDKAFRWWVRGLSYASRYLTDGLLPKVFWKQVPNGARTELVNTKLWDWIDPNFLIHDYHHHQSLREDVQADKERNREKAKAFRERRKAERRNVTGDVTGNVTGYVPTTSDRLVTDPENREHITENREQSKTKSANLIVGPAEFARLQEFNSFVGAKLRIPHKLHRELVSKSGANAEVELQKWYRDLDQQLEESGKGTGDIFEWLRPRHQAFAVSKGWIDAAPKAIHAVPKHRGVAEILAEREAAKGRAS